MWKVHADKTVEPVRIALGITDHAYTEMTGVLTGALRPGDEVVTGRSRRSARGRRAPAFGASE